MEDVRRRSGHRDFMEEDERVDSIQDDKQEKNTAAKIGNKRPFEDNNESHDQYNSSPKEKHLIPSCSKQGSAITVAEGSSMGNDSRGSSSNKKQKEDQLESARAEMDEVKEENQRLKMYLDRIMKDYQTLQTQFYGIVQQDSKRKSTDTAVDDDHHRDETEESDRFVSLSLGRFSSDHDSNNKDEKNINSSTSHGTKGDEEVKEELSLGLDYKYEPSKSEANESLPNQSPTNSFEESKEEGGETCPPSKALKMTRSPGDDEILQQNTVKKARVSVRTRCETPTMNDGCQWRKYGQKIAKGNPCPRAYYRCTVAPSCPVRKQVQRCAEDMSILITTYEGTHNHPLPVAATAMASTTSAAASMLLSGSSSSSRFGSLAPSTTTPTSPANLHGLNFYLSDKPKPFYLPNTSLSSSSPYQTITLDLTTPSSSSQFNRFSSSNYAPTSRYNVTSSTSLNFSSSSESNSAVQWGNGLFTYNTTQPYMKNHVGNSSLGRVQPIENIYQSYMQKTNPNPNPPSLQQSLPADTIAAATKAITADPTFQSALAAAITSIIGTGDGSSSGGAGGGSSGNSGQVVTGDNYGQKLVKWGSGQVSVGSSYSSQALKSNNIGCATSFLNRSSSTSTTNNNSQSGNLILSLPPVNNNTPPFSNSKSASASPNNGNKDPN